MKCKLYKLPFVSLEIIVNWHPIERPRWIAFKLNGKHLECSFLVFHLFKYLQTFALSVIVWEQDCSTIRYIYAQIWKQFMCPWSHGDGRKHRTRKRKEKQTMCTVNPPFPNSTQSSFHWDPCLLCELCTIRSRLTQPWFKNLAKWFNPKSSWTIWAPCNPLGAGDW